MNGEFKQGDLFLFFWRWRYAFLTGLVVSSLAGALVSSPIIMKPQYESQIVLFSTSTNSIDKSIDDQHFGYDIDADRLLQVLESETMRDSVIVRFDLINHYEIDTAQITWRSTLFETFAENVSFVRTRYMSVVVSVLDTDPQMAANMANGIAELVDVIRAGIIKRNSEASYNAAKKEYYDKLLMVEELQQQLNTAKAGNKQQVLSLQRGYLEEKNNKVAELRRQLDQIRQQYNIYDYGYQVNILNKALSDAKRDYISESGKFRVYDEIYSVKDTVWVNTKARMHGAKDEMEQFEKELKHLSAINQQYLSLSNRLDVERELQASSLKAYELTLSSFEPEFLNTELQKLNIIYTAELQMLGSLKQKYEKASQNYSKPLPATYVMNTAQAAGKKKYPVRSLIVGLAAFCGLGLTFGGILIGEKANGLNEFLRQNRKV